MITIADDSGLCVDALMVNQECILLDIVEQAMIKDNEKLIENLKGVENRKAKLRLCNNFSKT